MGLSETSRPLDVVGAGVRLAVGDVVRDRLMEQERLLRHEPDEGAKRSDRHLPDVPAVDRDAARRDVVESRQEVHERGLAGA